MPKILAAAFIHISFSIYIKYYSATLRNNLLKTSSNVVFFLIPSIGSSLFVELQFILTIVNYRIARAFNIPSATRAVGLDISKDFEC